MKLILTIEDECHNIQATIEDIEEYNLSKPLARAVVCLQIEELIKFFKETRK